MKRFQGKSIAIAGLVSVLILSGCTQNRPGGENVPTLAPNQPTDSQPTTIAIQPTATPTQMTDAAAANGGAANGGATSGGGDNAAPTNTPTTAPNPGSPAPTPLATATPVQSVPNPPQSGSSGQTIIHVVQSGENLFRIGLKYQIDVNTLARFNSIADPNEIYVDQRIKIPTGGSGSGQTYIVQPGDTLTIIAAKFGTTQQALLSINNLTNPDLIFIEQQLQIP